MEMNISNLEICCLAYDKKLDQMKTIIANDPDCVKKKDRVSHSMLVSLNIFYSMDLQDGRTTLHWACSSGAKDIVEYLLGVCHVRPDVSDEVRRTSIGFDRTHFI